MKMLSVLMIGVLSLAICGCCSCPKKGALPWIFSGGDKVAVPTLPANTDGWRGEKTNRGITLVEWNF